MHAQQSTKIINQSIEKMSKNSQTNDHGDVIIDMESLEKAQKNAKNEQSTKRLKETQSIQTSNDRSRIFWIILKITSLAVIAFIVCNNYCFNQTMDLQSINETQRKLQIEEMTTEQKRKFSQAFEAAESGYTNGKFIAQGGFGSVWKFKKGKEYVAIKFVHKMRYNKEEVQNHQLAYENEKIGQYVVKVQKKPAKQFEWLIWFELEWMDGDLESLVFKEGTKGWDEPIPIRNALTEGDMKKLMRDLAITLAELDSMNIVHGDLHLGNIMYKRSKGNYQFKLGDFGSSGKIKKDRFGGTNAYKDFQYYFLYMGMVMNANWEKPPTCPTTIKRTIGGLEAVEGKERTMEKLLQVLVKEGILEENWEEIEIEKRRNEERIQREREKEELQREQEEKHNKSKDRLMAGKDEKGVTADTTPPKISAESGVSKPLPSIITAIVVVIVVFLMN